MLIILSSIFVSLSILLFLVYIIIYAEGKLLPQGKVKILINNDEDKSPSVSPGSTLLSALSASNIFIPSACGGGGTCAMCLCKIHKGGGEILSTELNHISRKEAKQDWRLACQVKVREDMEVTVPEEIFNIQKWECTVKSNNSVATFIKELVLDFNPSKVIIYEGDNDISSGHKINFILKNIKSIIKKIEEKNKNAQIILISAKPSIMRWDLRKKYIQLNKKYKNLALKRNNIHYADTWSEMVDSGELKTDIFIEDGLHLNEKGYKIWEEVLRPILESTD